MFPVGVVTVKVTLAPETAVPPFITETVIGTVPGLMKLAPEIETLTASEGGVTTVAFAMSVTVDREFAAVRSTA